MICYELYMVEKRKYASVAVGVSSGGLYALHTLLSSLPKNFPLPVFVVQHLSRDADQILVEYLKRKTGFPIKQAEDKEDIRGGTVYLAPPDYHLLVEVDGRSLALSKDPAVNYARPSIDVLFESAAAALRDSLIGVIMTGSGADGSKGLRSIKQHGGYTIVQDPASAESAMMPQAAIDAAEIDEIAPLEELGGVLVKLAQIPADRRR